LTQQRIREWVSEYPSYISFSGGKDSTVLLHIARNFCLTKDIPAVFVDTGLEYPEVRQFALSQENVIRVKPEMTFRKVIETYGYPVISKEVAKRVTEYRNAERKGRLTESSAYKEFNGLLRKANGEKSFFNKEKWKFLVDSDFLISHRCCDVMKKNPAKKFQKESGRTPIIATMAYESQTRKMAWLKTGCNAFDSQNPHSQPMSFWTEQDVLQYLRDYSVPYASVYGEIKEDENGKLYTTGCDRTGCVFCGFGCHLEKKPN